MPRLLLRSVGNFGSGCGLLARLSHLRLCGRLLLWFIGGSQCAWIRRLLLCRRIRLLRRPHGCGLLLCKQRTGSNKYKGRDYRQGYRTHECTFDSPEPAGDGRPRVGRGFLGIGPAWSRSPRRASSRDTPRGSKSSSSCPLKDGFAVLCNFLRCAFSVRSGVHETLCQSS